MKKHHLVFFFRLCAVLIPKAQQKSNILVIPGDDVGIVSININRQAPSPLPEFQTSND